MNKILISNEDIEYIFKWKDEHKDYVRQGHCPIKAVEIILTDSDSAIKAIRKGDVLTLYLRFNGKALGKGVFVFNEPDVPKGCSRLVRSTWKLEGEAVEDIHTLYCSLMALMVYGRSPIENPSTSSSPTQRKPSKSSQKPSVASQRNSITYILSKASNGLQVIPQGSHRKPQGQFSVRGHFRHYKSGKVVWVSEFTKGTGKKQDKTYKLGKIE